MNRFNLNIINLLFLFITLIILSLNILYVYKPSIIRDDIQYLNYDYDINNLNNQNISIIEIIGISMNPTMYQGNKILCDNSITEYKNGMIVRVNNSNDFYIHRIKAIYKDYILTKGDNNKYADKKINHSQINCVVIGVLY